MPSTIKIKRSSVAGTTPAALAHGELAINTADRKLYASTEAGEIFSFNASRDPSLYLFAHATDGDDLYIGRLAWDDYPAEGDADDVADWTIYKISTDSAGEVTGEQSATGAWSNRLSLF